ncbi:GtrA family protein [Pantoea phytobeneficialis]|uniref:Bactoprenol-linked glucose translocase n=1 Tax=Pantoea phytobeneficialis TaxID=2052056 RepID=A0AAP9H786_9GAMM|nr:GtrA family protein [Pantoea phytobeneficialis]MDO6405285.1 GtrA family protein [Pantoea phytobeneficialis]QGR07806.1 translocase [Pantoea phytobeneficialis]
MLKRFTRYASIGVLNTLIHWVIFGTLYNLGFKQSVSNFIAFCTAVTFSFFANARWTFNAQATTARYIFYTVFMGATALAVGWAADNAHINPLLTLILFSAISLVCGFFWSKLFVFRVRK